MPLKVKAIEVTSIWKEDVILSDISQTGIIPSARPNATDTSRSLVSLNKFAGEK